jgi:beta-phosphoglucomutase-like phosphatase (HAD superfamily)
VDGEVANQLKLPGKPAPDKFLKAAQQLEVEPDRAVVVEDAISGVQAGRAGGFALVIGVDRKGQAEELRKNGAHIVVSDPGELL